MTRRTLIYGLALFAGIAAVGISVQLSAASPKHLTALVAANEKAGDDTCWANPQHTINPNSDTYKEVPIEYQSPKGTWIPDYLKVCSQCDAQNVDPNKALANWVAVHRAQAQREKAEGYFAPRGKEALAARVIAGLESARLRRH